MSSIKGFVLSLLLACTKTEKAPSAGSATATTPAPTAATAPAETAKPPLSSYLDTAVAAKLFEIKLDPSGPVKKSETKQLGEKETKDYLARIGLAQRADGPVVRCPNDAELVLSDASGKVLGTIGFCQDHARFDAPDGTFGGINATRP
ncbi:MAG TPA: hypothetical protein VM513_25310 [Kofleriaceae bacterium]|nr:hypothetical protein [Kofleriaceae bacterium]